MFINNRLINYKGAKLQRILDIVELARVIQGFDSFDNTLTLIDMPKPYLEHFPNIIALCEPYAPGAFYLCIAPNQSKATLLLAIAHEFIHLGQYLDGDLVMAPDKKSLIYKGEVLYPPYDPKQPHEVVAYANDNKLAKLIKENLKLQKTKR